MTERNIECYKHFSDEIAEILQEQVRLGGEITKLAVGIGKRGFDPEQELQELVAQSKTAQAKLMEIIVTATISARYSRKDYDIIREKIHEQNQEDLFEDLLS